jgi:hypothetical protein
MVLARWKKRGTDLGGLRATVLISRSLAKLWQFQDLGLLGVSSWLLVQLKGGFETNYCQVQSTGDYVM